MPTRLLLIRHGLTPWNKAKRYCGSVDISLDPIGRSQARKLGKRLKNQKIDCVYASNKKRAIETANIIFGKEKVRIEPDLREISFGVFEGLTYKKALALHPRIYRKLLKYPYKARIPDGESLVEFDKRVVRAFMNIVANNKNKIVAIVCHAGPISIFLNHILKSRDFWGMISGSASLSIVEFNSNGKARIVFFNDTNHLGNGVKFLHASAYKV